jgi:hypothetical protein
MESIRLLSAEHLRREFSKPQMKKDFDLKAPRESSRFPRV